MEFGIRPLTKLLTAIAGNIRTLYAEKTSESGVYLVCKGAKTFVTSLLIEPNKQSEANKNLACMSILSETLVRKGRMLQYFLPAQRRQSAYKLIRDWSCSRQGF